MIFLFLGSVRAVIIPVVRSISLIGAVFLMQVAGFTISTAAAVARSAWWSDDAIVMVENIDDISTRARGRSRRPGGGPRAGRADHRHDDHAGKVYTPVAIQGGLTGSLFREFAFTLAGAVIVSESWPSSFAHDGFEARPRGGYRARVRRLDQPPIRPDP